MSFLEGIVEKVATTCGMDAEDAEVLADAVSCGTNIAVGNYAGATADGLDLVELDDDLPWLAQGLEIAGGDPLGPTGAGGAGPARDLSPTSLQGELNVDLTFRV